MITLTLEEDQVLSGTQKISDPAFFLKNLPPRSELTLIFKIYEVKYFVCPFRKAAPYLKSGEYSQDHWIGEKPLSSNRLLIAGFLPSKFMTEIVQIIAQGSFILKKSILWTDLIVNSYKPSSTGWALILHQHSLFICFDGTLCISRLCYQSLSQELPSILRYIKRFGYKEGSPITLLSSSAYQDSLPPFVHFEKRTPHESIQENTLTLQIPQLRTHHLLYIWARKIRTIGYGIAFFNLLGSAYFGWQLTVKSSSESFFMQKVDSLSKQTSIDESKLIAFETYCRLSADRANPLILLRQLMPFFKNNAIATSLHWTSNPKSLILHLELSPATHIDPFLMTIRSRLHHYHLEWKKDEEDISKGVLRLTQNEF
ncbi:MAG: hypothetical protein FJX71_05195 [Alphaproteobacteria bacterium]|nr:hypothetical protein [Alphaproteobacteria bacterium]